LCQTATDTAIVTMEGEYETVPMLSNVMLPLSMTFSDL